MILCSNNCVPPDFADDKSKFDYYDNGRRHHRGMLKNIPDEVRQCMKDNMRQSEVKKLNKCLQKHEVPLLQTDEDPLFHNDNETVDAL